MITVYEVVDSNTYKILFVYRTSKQAFNKSHKLNISGNYTTVRQTRYSGR